MTNYSIIAIINLSYLTNTFQTLVFIIASTCHFTTILIVNK
nr:MAG TPA: hypothetical protein [Crassvirales sp.]